MPFAVVVVVVNHTSHGMMASTMEETAYMIDEEP